ncbi:MAG: TolC family protein [Phycisphaerales bacterium]
MNPSAGDLEFNAADEARDVEGRLDTFARGSESARIMDLEDVLRESQSTAREFINAEEEYILAVLRLLIQRHQWGPRFFNDVTASANITPDGTGDFSSAARIVNEFRVTQRLPYGGDIEARALWEASQQLRSVAGDQYRTASELSVSANIPLLRDAGLIAQEDIIQAERDVIYAARDFERFRREFFVSISTDYFDLLASAQAIANEAVRLENLLQERDRMGALVDAGRRSPFELSSIEQDVLGSRNSLYNQQESYRVSLDRFKIRLGLPVEQELALAPVSLELPEPEVSLLAASEAALMYRLDYQNAMDRFDDARRDLLNARNQLLPDLNVGLSATARSDPESDDKKGFTVDLNDTDFLASVTFGLPLDREIERLGLRTSLINAQRQARDLDERRDSIVLEARAAVRNIELARLSIRLRGAQVQQNERRLVEIKINEAVVDTQDRLQAEADLLNARNALANAKRDLRVAILNYLLATDQLRVGVDGGLVPLVGMTVREGDPIDPAPMMPIGEGLDDPALGGDDGG